MICLKARAAAMLALLLAIAATTSHLGASAPQDPQAPAPIETAGDISPEALAQIDALIREKESRSPSDRKLDSQLIYELKMRAGAQIALGVQTIETDVPYADDGHAVLDVKATLTAALIEGLAQLGAESPVDVRSGVNRPHPHRDRSRAGARGDAGRDLRSATPGRDYVAARPSVRRIRDSRSALARSLSGVTAASRPSVQRHPGTDGAGQPQLRRGHHASRGRGASGLRHDRRRDQDRRALGRRPQPRRQPGGRRTSAPSRSSVRRRRAPASSSATKARRCSRSSTTSRPAPSSTSRAGWSASPASPTTSARCARPAATSSSTTCSTSSRRRFRTARRRRSSRTATAASSSRP